MRVGPSEVDEDSAATVDGHGINARKTLLERHSEQAKIGEGGAGRILLGRVGERVAGGRAGIGEGGIASRSAGKLEAVRQRAESGWEASVRMGRVVLDEAATEKREGVMG